MSGASGLRVPSNPFEGGSQGGNVLGRAAGSGLGMVPGAIQTAQQNPYSSFNNYGVTPPGFYSPPPWMGYGNQQMQNQIGLNQPVRLFDYQTPNYSYAPRPATSGKGGGATQPADDERMPGAMGRFMPLGVQQRMPVEATRTISGKGR